VTEPTLNALYQDLVHFVPAVIGIPALSSGDVIAVFLRCALPMESVEAVMVTNEPTCMDCISFRALNPPVLCLRCGASFTWWLHPVQLCDDCVEVEMKDLAW